MATKKTINKKAKADPIVDEPLDSTVVETAELVTEEPDAKEAVEDIEVIESAEVSAPKSKTCTPLVDHSCVIGGKKITVVKDKKIKLPEGVAMVLQQSRIVIVN